MLELRQRDVVFGIKQVVYLAVGVYAIVSLHVLRRHQVVTADQESNSHTKADCSQYRVFIACWLDKAV